MKRPLIATLAAMLALGAVAAPAQAEEMNIEYADLDLSTAEGQQKLKTRIDRAAREICGYGKTTTGTRLHSRETKQCYEQAKRAATEQMAALVDSARMGG